MPPACIVTCGRLNGRVPAVSDCCEFKWVNGHLHITTTGQKYGGLGAHYQHSYIHPANMTRDLPKCLCFQANLDDRELIYMPETRSNAYLAACVAYLMFTQDVHRLGNDTLHDLSTTHAAAESRVVLQDITATVTRVVLQDITALAAHPVPEKLRISRSKLELPDGIYGVHLRY